MSYENLTLKKYFLEFYGGQATQDEPNRILDIQSPDLVNVRPVGRGAYAPRNGISLVGDADATVGSIKNIHNLRKTDEQILVRYTDPETGNPTLQFLDKADSTHKVIPGCPTFTPDTVMGMEHDERYLYACNAVEDFIQWDGKNIAATVFTADATSNELTSVAHGLDEGDIVVLTTTGTLPGGLGLATPYFVRYLTVDTFSLATTAGGTAIDIIDSGSGIHSFQSSVKTYSAIPKGNILETYLGRLFIAGNIENPTTVYYSVVGDATDFSGTGSGNESFGEGGDPITALKCNTIPTGIKALFVIKKASFMYALTFDSDGNISVQELKRGSGAVNDKSTIIIENDIFFVDPGQNISQMGFVDNIPNDIRTNPAARSIKRSLTTYDMSDACAVYSKKYDMALYGVRKFGATFNETVLMFSTEHLSWWVWKGINANEFTEYLNEIVWASSIDMNTYMYDTTKFDDNYQGDDTEGAGAIRSYRATRDEEFNEVGVLSRVGMLSDRYKQSRFVKIRGYISVGAEMFIHKIYDGNNATKVTSSFMGSDANITTPEVTVSFGANVFGHQIFGGSISSPSDFPMREFFCVVSLDGYSNLRSRTIIEVEEAGMPYLITMISDWAELQDEEKEPIGIRI